MAKWKGVLVVAAAILAALPAVPRPAGREVTVYVQNPFSE
jgi:hypothetical protein